MNKIISTVAVIFALGITTASAGMVEIGNEFRSHNEPYKSDDQQMPYIAYSVNPFKDKNWNFVGKMDFRYMDLHDTRSWNNRLRHVFAGGYKFDLGRLTWNPKLGFRTSVYPDGARTTEYRIYPGLNYKLTDQTSVGFGGWLAPTRSHAKSRDSSASNRPYEDFEEYTHELELKLAHTLAPGQRVLAVLYHESFSKEYEPREDKTKNVNSLQLRLFYKHNFGDFALEPFVRIDLTRHREDDFGNEKDELRNRYGVMGSYKVSKKFHILSEVYQEVEDQRDWDNNPAKHDEKKYMFYKLSLRYNFK